MSSKAKIEALQTALQKRYPRLPKAPERSIFLHLMYAACLENVTHDAADAAMVVLEQQFVDWNEVRVSTPAELSESLSHVLPTPSQNTLPVGLTVGERIKRALQAVFERSYTFTLDDIPSMRPAANAIAALKGLTGLTPFMVDYVVQHALGGHVVPLDEAALRVMRRLGLVHLDAGNETVPPLTRVVAKADGLDFATRLHSLAAEFFATHDSAAILKFLKGIDPDSVNRSWLPPSSPLPPPAALPIEVKTSNSAPVAPEPPKQAPTKAVPPKPTPTKTVTPKTNAPKTPAAKTTPTKSVPTKPPPPKAVPTKPAPTKTAPAKPSPAKSAPAKAAPVKKAPTKVAPKPAPKKPAPKKAAPKKAAPAVKKPVNKPASKAAKPAKKPVKTAKKPAKQAEPSRQSSTKQLRRSKPR